MHVRSTHERAADRAAPHLVAAFRRHLSPPQRPAVVDVPHLPGLATRGQGRGLAFLVVLDDRAASMTVVAAIAHDGHVTMAADTCTSYQGTDIILGERKIRRITVGDTEALLAASGNGALLGVLQRHWKLDDAPDPDDDHDVLAWAEAAASSATEILADQTPALLRDVGEGEQQIDGGLLMGWAGRLIYLFTHQAIVVHDGIAGLGIGTDMAIGVMHAQEWQGIDPRIAATRAVELACRYLERCRVGPDGPQTEQV